VKQSKYRKLNASELKARGLGPKSKTRVLASVKRVTAKTRVYSDRELHQKNIRARKLAEARTPAERKAARTFTKERYASLRYVETKTKSGVYNTTYNDMTQREFFRVLKRNEGRYVVPHFLAERQSFGPSGTGDGEAKWSSGTRIKPHEIDTTKGLNFWLDKWGFVSDPLRYGVQIVAS
jgi:hypothetical protein